MLCPSCGEKIPDTSKFCPECGARLARPAPDSVGRRDDSDTGNLSHDERGADDGGRALDVDRVGGLWRRGIVVAQLPLTALALAASAAVLLLDLGRTAGVPAAVAGQVRVVDLVFGAAQLGLAIACLVVRHEVATLRKAAPAHVQALLGVEILVLFLHAFIVSLVMRVEVAAVMPAQSMAQIIWCVLLVLLNKLYFGAQRDRYDR